MSKNGVGTGIWNSRKQDAFNHMIILHGLRFGVYIHDNVSRSERLIHWRASAVTYNLLIVHPAPSFLVKVKNLGFIKIDPIFTANLIYLKY